MPQTVSRLADVRGAFDDTSDEDDIEAGPGPRRQSDDGPSPFMATFFGQVDEVRALPSKSRPADLGKVCGDGAGSSLVGGP